MSFVFSTAYSFYQNVFAVSRIFLTFLFFITLSSAERYTSYHAARVLSTLFYLFFCLSVSIRQQVINRHSMSGEGGIWTLAPLLTTCTLSRGVPSASLGTSPVEYFSYSFFKHSSKEDERREWDSNPRALADKRFSRPPRYDHFDISPTTFPQSRELCLQLSRCFISSPLLKSAQKWFYHLLDQLSI